MYILHSQMDTPLWQGIYCQSEEQGITIFIYPIKPWSDLYYEIRETVSMTACHFFTFLENILYIQAIFKGKQTQFGPLILKTFIYMYVKN